MTNRNQASIDLKGLTEKVIEFKNSVEWRYIPLALRLRILLIERLALPADLQNFLQDSLTALESGETEKVIDDLKEIIRKMQEPV